MQEIRVNRTVWVQTPQNRILRPAWAGCACLYGYTKIGRASAQILKDPCCIDRKRYNIGLVWSTRLKVEVLESIHCLSALPLCMYLNVSVCICMYHICICVYVCVAGVLMIVCVCICCRTSLNGCQAMGR